MPSYYVKYKSRVKGPFSADQLRLMAERGQLSHLHLVSEDRNTWVNIDDIENLYPESEEISSKGKRTRRSEPSLDDTTDLSIDEESAFESNKIVNTQQGVDQGDSWFYADGSESIGPLNGTLLKSLAKNGTIKSTTTVWREGSDSGAPAKLISILAPIFESKTGDNNSLFDSNFGHDRSIHGEDVVETKSPTAFVVISLVFLISSLTLAAFFIYGTVNEWIISEESAITIIIIFALNVGLWITIIIISCIELHRSWRTVQELRYNNNDNNNHLGIPTPGKAVGFLFIPFFNLYWIFIAYVRLSHAQKAMLSRLVSSADRKPPRPSPGLSITFCVLFCVSIALGFIPLVGHLIGIATNIVFIIVTENMYKVTNGIIVLKRRHANGSR